MMYDITMGSLIYSNLTPKTMSSPAQYVYPQSPEHIKDFRDYINDRSVEKSVDIIVEEHMESLDGSGVVSVYCGATKSGYNKLVQYFSERLGIPNQEPAVFNIPEKHIDRKNSFAIQVAQQIIFANEYLVIEGRNFNEIIAQRPEGYYRREAHDLDQNMAGYVREMGNMYPGFALELAQQFNKKLLVLTHVHYGWEVVESDYNRALVSAGNSEIGKLMSAFDPNIFSFS